MAKKVVGFIKLRCRRARRIRSSRWSGAGSARREHHEFCKQFNARTQGQAGLIIPVEITVYADRSFTFVTKSPPAAVLLKKAAGVEKGSAKPNKEKIGQVTRQQVREIAEMKLPDLNAASIESAMRMIEGTARSMGLKVVD